MPGTPKFLGLNMTGPIFFQTRNSPFQRKLSTYYCLFMFCRLSCHIVELLFFYIIVAFSVLIHLCCLYFY